jgi:hypothetical protein
MENSQFLFVTSSDLSATVGKDRQVNKSQSEGGGSGPGSDTDEESFRFPFKSIAALVQLHFCFVSFHNHNLFSKWMQVKAISKLLI